ncbi:hypothetical protein KKG90_03980 [Candidatus Bipolaricaulota bacterium]|nr:hypothetical protein [Candidatus Bipolaricaulota bacterium]
MNAENEIPRPDEQDSTKSSRRHGIGRVLAVLLAGAIALVGGFVNGSNYGGNYAPDLSFLGSPGYEGGALMGGMVAAVTILLIAGLSIGLQRRGVAALSTVGALAGIVLVPPMLFPSIAPSEALFALSYIGSGVVGALIGTAIGALVFSPRGQ